jgi:hypothetical protein
MMMSGSRASTDDDFYRMFEYRQLDKLITYLDDATLGETPPGKLYASAVIELARPDINIRLSHGLARWKLPLDEQALLNFHKAFVIASRIILDEEVAARIKQFIIENMHQFNCQFAQASAEYKKMICDDFGIPDHPLPAQPAAVEEPARVNPPASDVRLSTSSAAFFAAREEERDSEFSYMQILQCCSCSVV